MQSSVKSVDAVAKPVDRVHCHQVDQMWKKYSNRILHGVIYVIACLGKLSLELEAGARHLSQNSSSPAADKNKQAVKEKRLT